MTAQQPILKSTRITDVYLSLLETISRELPRIDADLVIKVLIHIHKYKERPRIRLEIIYAKDVDASDKKEDVYARIERWGEVREGHILIIDGYFKLEDIEELAQDKQIEMIRGEIIF